MRSEAVGVATFGTGALSSCGLKQGYRHVSTWRGSLWRARPRCPCTRGGGLFLCRGSHVFTCLCLESPGDRIFLDIDGVVPLDVAGSFLLLYGASSDGRAVISFALCADTVALMET